MLDLYKLREVMIWLYDCIKDEATFEDFCILLGEAIGIDAEKLELLSIYDVAIVFPDLSNLSTQSH